MSAAATYFTPRGLTGQLYQRRRRRDDSGGKVETPQGLRGEKIYGEIQKQLINKLPGGRQLSNIYRWVSDPESKLQVEAKKFATRTAFSTVLGSRYQKNPLSFAYDMMVKPEKTIGRVVFNSVLMGDGFRWLGYRRERTEKTHKVLRRGREVTVPLRQKVLGLHVGPIQTEVNWVARQGAIGTELRRVSDFMDGVYTYANPIHWLNGDVFKRWETGQTKLNKVGKGVREVTLKNGKVVRKPRIRNKKAFARRMSQRSAFRRGLSNIGGWARTIQSSAYSVASLGFLGNKDLADIGWAAENIVSSVTVRGDFGGTAIKTLSVRTSKAGGRAGFARGVHSVTRTLNPVNLLTGESLRNMAFREMALGPTEILALGTQVPSMRVGRGGLRVPTSGRLTDGRLIRIFHHTNRMEPLAATLRTVRGRRLFRVFGREIRTGHLAAIPYYLHPANLLGRELPRLLRNRMEHGWIGRRVRQLERRYNIRGLRHHVNRARNRIMQTGFGRNVLARMQGVPLLRGLINRGPLGLASNIYGIGLWLSDPEEAAQRLVENLVERAIRRVFRRGARRPGRTIRTRAGRRSIRTLARGARNLARRAGRAVGRAARRVASRVGQQVTRRVSQTAVSNALKWVGRTIAAEIIAPLASAIAGLAGGIFIPILLILLAIIAAIALVFLLTYLLVMLLSVVFKTSQAPDIGTESFEVEKRVVAIDNDQSKSTIDSADGLVHEIEYVVTIRNNSTVEVTNVIVEDLTTGTVLDPVIVPGRPSSGSEEGTSTTGFTLEQKLTASVTANTDKVYTNTVRATGQMGTTPVEAFDSASVIIGNPPLSEALFCGWPSSGRITSLYGTPTPIESRHSGVDIAPGVFSTATPVFSTLNGVVTSAYWGDKYGGLLRVSSLDNRFDVDYLHLSAGTINDWQGRIGEQVAISEQIGLEHQGMLPYSTGTHLHYRIILDNVTVDPGPYLPSTPKLQSTVSAPGSFGQCKDPYAQVG